MYGLPLRLLQKINPTPQLSSAPHFGKRNYLRFKYKSTNNLHYWKDDILKVYYKKLLEVPSEVMTKTIATAFGSAYIRGKKRRRTKQNKSVHRQSPSLDFEDSNN